MYHNKLIMLHNNVWNYETNGLPYARHARKTSNITSRGSRAKRAKSRYFIHFTGSILSSFIYTLDKGDQIGMAT